MHLDGNQDNYISSHSECIWKSIFFCINNREKVDLDRVPQIIYEANCLNSHSCKGVDSSFSLESVPIAIKMPFLRKTKMPNLRTGIRGRQYRLYMCYIQTELALGLAVHALDSILIIIIPSLIFNVNHKEVYWILMLAVLNKQQHNAYAAIQMPWVAKCL